MSSPTTILQTDVEDLDLELEVTNKIGQAQLPAAKLQQTKLQVSKPKTAHNVAPETDKKLKDKKPGCVKLDISSSDSDASSVYNEESKSVKKDKVAQNKHKATQIYVRVMEEIRELKKLKGISQAPDEIKLNEYRYLGRKTVVGCL